MKRLEDAPRRNAPPGHIEREMTRLLRSRELNGVPQWDLPHGVVTVHWDGRRMWSDEPHVITLSTHPDEIPKRLMQIGQETTEAQFELVERGQSPTLYAFMVVMETHKVVHNPRTASEYDAARMRRDRIQRRFHERPDAIETCDVMAADIDGRFWLADRARHEPRRIQRRFWPGRDVGCVTKDKQWAGAQWPTGQLARMVAAVATVAAVMLHGDRMPSPIDLAAGDGGVIPLRADQSR